MKNPAQTLWKGCLAFHLVAAIFSVGFLHADEHFQILEFAAAKLGVTPAEWLPWEYHSRIRPWLQPAFVFSVFKVFQAVGYTDPFGIVFFLRLLSAALGCFALLKILQWNRLQPASSFWKAQIQWFVAFSWFLPLLHARTSSENWAGSLLVLGILPLLAAQGATRPRSWTFLGFLLGTAFLLRYQMGIAIAGFALWSWWAGTLPRRTTLYCCLGFALALGMGTLLDYWGYGVWQFTPWEYFRVNLLEGKASWYGKEPFTFYFQRLIWSLGPPLSLFFLVGVLLFWIFCFRHPLTGATLPFFCIHLGLAHKELRFLFPLANFLPLLSLLGWQRFFSSRPLPPKMQRMLKFFKVQNLLLTLPAILLPLTPLHLLQRAVWNQESQLLLSWKHSLYWDGIAGLGLFRPKGLEERVLQATVPRPPPPFLLYLPEAHFPPELQNLRPYCHRIFPLQEQGILAWLLASMERYVRFHGLYSCH